MRPPPSKFSRLNLLAAAALASALHSPLSHALALGQARVLSALGEPLLAEIEIPQITPQEMAALTAGLGSPAQYEAAGMAYHPSLRQTVLSVHRRADGRMFLRVAGTAPVNESYMELLVLARGGAQPLLRDYTLLLERRAPPDTPLALGQARVLSARGEPLRAEIDVPQLPQGKSAGTRVGVASAADYQAAGMAYNPGLADIRLSLQRRPDGRSFMSLTSEKPFNAASLDLLLEAASAVGRTVRDYSVPIPPPPDVSTRVATGPVTPAPDAPAPAPAPAPASASAPAAAPAPVVAATVVTPPAPPPAPNLPIISLPPAPPTAAAPAAAAPAAPAAVAAVAAVASAPATPASPAASVATAAPAPAVAPAPAPVPPPRIAPDAPPEPATPPRIVAAAPPVVAAPLPPNAVATAEPARQVKVRAGDTLSRIARANKPAKVSLDQMLLALLRANPDAFIGGNVNLLRAGADLSIPSPDQAGAVPDREARTVLALQSRDFDEYRRQLAAGAPRMASNPRQANGKIEATVSEKKAAPPSRNRLSLSAGAVGGATAVEKSIAAQLAKMAQERAARLASVANAVSRLQEPASAPGAASAASSAASGAAVTLPSR